MNLSNMDERMCYAVYVQHIFIERLVLNKMNRNTQYIIITIILHII